jgi:hypothetical protein
VFAALRRFGAPLEQHGVTESLFATEHYGYRMGRKPILIEVLSRATICPRRDRTRTRP